MKILMVCLGNICRSPLAEGIMKEKITKKGLDWEVDSAGTGSWHVGELPDPRSILKAKENGIDITDQNARQFQKSDLDSFDLILAMDSSNYNDINRLTTNDDHRNKVQLIMNFVKPGFNQNVPDPYWDDDGFEKVFQMLDLACDKIIEKYAS
ncbi:MAG: low molecular weight protein-tyrosine-phosphatase [Saprospiraceae bacterium]